MRDQVTYPYPPPDDHITSLASLQAVLARQLNLLVTMHLIGTTVVDFPAGAVAKAATATTAGGGERTANSLAYVVAHYFARSGAPELVRYYGVYRDLWVWSQEDGVGWRSRRVLEPFVSDSFSEYPPSRPPPQKPPFSWRGFFGFGWWFFLFRTLIFLYIFWLLGRCRYHCYLKGTMLCKTGKKSQKPRKKENR